MADGAAITTLGAAKFDFRIGDTTYTQDCIIAEVESAVVIGYDFLQEHHCLVDFHTRTISVGGQVIKCQHEDQLFSSTRIIVVC